MLHVADDLVFLVQGAGELFSCEAFMLEAMHCLVSGLLVVLVRHDYLLQVSQCRTSCEGHLLAKSSYLKTVFL